VDVEVVSLTAARLSIHERDGIKLAWINPELGGAQIIYEEWPWANLATKEGEELKLCAFIWCFLFKVKLRKNPSNMLGLPIDINVGLDDIKWLELEYKEMFYDFNVIGVPYKFKDPSMIRIPSITLPCLINTEVPAQDPTSNPSDDLNVLWQKVVDNQAEAQQIADGQVAAPPLPADATSGNAINAIQSEVDQELDLSYAVVIEYEMSGKQNGLCNGPETDFNSGADLPTGYSFDSNVAGWRKCGGTPLADCFSDCLANPKCNSMSSNEDCCFLYEAKICPSSTHAASQQYDTYFKTVKGDAGLTRYWVDDGCTNDGDEFLGLFADEHENIAAARCCTDSGTCTSPVSCPQSLTFSEASDVCTSSGLRLCTRDELLSDVCCGAGGNCDNYLVWTSTSYAAAVAQAAVAAIANR